MDPHGHFHDFGDRLPQEVLTQDLLTVDDLFLPLEICHREGRLESKVADQVPLLLRIQIRLVQEDQHVDGDDSVSEDREALRAVLVPDRKHWISSYPLPRDCRRNSIPPSFRLSTSHFPLPTSDFPQPPPGTPRASPPPSSRPKTPPGRASVPIVPSPRPALGAAVPPGWPRRASPRRTEAPAVPRGRA